MSLGAVATKEDLEGFPFQLFLWVTVPSGSITPREVQVFLRMLDNSSWCQSQWARENLYRTRERYADLWSVEALSSIKRDVELVHAGLRSLRDLLPAADVTAVRTDLQRLAEATARASGGILGQGALRRERRDALLVFAALADAVLLAPDRPTVAGPRAVAPALPAARPAAAATGRSRRRVRCVQVTDEAPDVRTFRFAAMTPGSFEYLPGQFTTVEVESNGERLTRSYTIASSPSRPGVLELTVKRVPGGRMSNWLHDHLRVGDEVTVSGPAGKFSCELGQKADKLLFISAGSGITPVMSMSRFLHDNADPRDVVFLYSARNERDLIFRDELTWIAARNTNFRVIFTLTSANDNWPGFQGRISMQLIEDAVPDFRQRTAFVCGPTPFMETMKEVLSASGFPMTNFNAESFGGRRAAGPVPSGQTVGAPPAGAPPLLPAGAEDAGEAERPRRSSRLLGLLPRPRLTLVSDPTGSVPAPANGPPEGANATVAAEGAVVFSASGREARHCSGETILEAAEALGLSLPSACRSGVCGTCKTRKLSGTVRMECSDGLDPGDRSAGFVLACTAHPLDRVVVEA